MDVWVSREDLLTLVGEATIYRNSEPRGKWIWRRAKRNGPTGQPPKEYRLDSLPADLQLAWLKLDGERRAGAAPAEIDAGTSSGSPPLESRFPTRVLMMGSDYVEPIIRTHHRRN